METIEVRRIISCQTLEEFARDLIFHKGKHPDAKIEKNSVSIEDWRGFTLFEAVLLYQEEVRK